MGTPAWLPRLLRLSALILCMVCLSGCGVGYIWHVAVGQMSILARQRAVEDVLQDAHLTPQEQQKIRLRQNHQEHGDREVGQGEENSPALHAENQVPRILLLWPSI